MSSALSLEERVSSLEADMAAMKRTLNGPASQPWWKKTCGSMKAFPEWAEVVRLGRELSESAEVDGAEELRP